ncbi:MAG: hypothetical protein GY820_26985, partial [Gammaproteobacteria bacterium]|nr:hypothetical protein [Gammaproteobacteria bacterium]
MPAKKFQVSSRHPPMCDVVGQSIRNFVQTCINWCSNSRFNFISIHQSLLEEEVPMAAKKCKVSSRHPPMCDVLGQSIRNFAQTCINDRCDSGFNFISIHQSLLEEEVPMASKKCKVSSRHPPMCDVVGQSIRNFVQTCINWCSNSGFNFISIHQSLLEEEVPMAAKKCKVSSRHPP